MEPNKKQSTNKITSKLKKLNLVQWLGLNRYTKNIIILVALAIFFASNLLLMPVSLRLDLSKGKAYTLSSSTKKIINNLDNDATVTFLVSADLPTRLQSIKRDVTDLLQEYDRTSGRVQVKIVDPKDDTKVAQKAQDAGIKELQFSQVENDKYAVSNFYFGILIEYKDKKEAIPQATDLGSLEYNITSAIYKLTQKELPQIALVGKQPPLIPQIPNPNSQFVAVAQRQFDIQFASPPEAPPSAEPDAPSPTPAPLELKPTYKTAMIFAKDGGDYNDQEIKAIRTYIANKGNAIFFVNGVTIDDRQLSATATQSKLVALLKEYGVDIQNNLILSTKSEVVNVGNQQFTVFLPYPLWLSTSTFNTDVSYFTNVNQLSFLWSSSLVLGTNNNSTVRDLAKTTDQSWAQTGTFNLNPQQIPQPTQDELKQFTVSAESTGSNRGKVLVIASPHFIDDAYLSRESNNLGFILNVLNDYASGGALSGINQRQVDVYPLPDIPDDMKQLFKYGNVILLPGLFALYGVYRLVQRNKKKSDL